MAKIVHESDLKVRDALFVQATKGEQVRDEKMLSLFSSQLSEG